MSKSIVLVFLILCFLFVIVGCHTVSKCVDYYSACVNDSECMAQMRLTGNITNIAVTRAVSNVPAGFGVAELLGSFAGMLASAAAGIYYGRRKVKGG